MVKVTAGPGQMVKWYLEMGPDGQFVAKYKKVPQLPPSPVEETPTDARSQVRSTINSTSNDITNSTSSKISNTPNDKTEIDTAGKAMTTWWLKMTILTALHGSLILFLFRPELEHMNINDSITHTIIHTLRGMCAASGICVGVGYYAFTLLFNWQQSPSLAHQLYSTGGHTMPFFLYILLDFSTHVLATISLYLHWGEHITPLAILMAFFFHRLWSLYHSGLRTAFFKGDEIYEFQQQVPAWMWVWVYLIETLSLCCLFAVHR